MEEDISMYTWITFSLHCYPSNVDQFRGGRGGIWAQEEKWRFLEKKSVLPVCVHWRTYLVCAVTVTLWVRPDWDMSGISGCLRQANNKASLHTDGFKGQAAATNERRGEGEPVTRVVSCSSFFLNNLVVSLWPWTCKPYLLASSLTSPHPGTALPLPRFILFRSVHPVRL